MESMELQTNFDPKALGTPNPGADRRPPTSKSQLAGETSLPVIQADSQSASQPPTHQPSQQDAKAACSGTDLLLFHGPDLSITANPNRFLDAAHAGSPEANWQLCLAVASCG